jgi:hypothetical protein
MNPQINADSGSGSLACHALRTWRLGVAFFVGVGFLILILDYIHIEGSRPGRAEAPRGMGAVLTSVGVYAWPLVHVIAVGWLSYFEFWLYLWEKTRRAGPLAPRVRRRFKILSFVCLGACYLGSVVLTQLCLGNLAEKGING